MKWIGSSNPKFKDGYWSGLYDYRNGRRDPVTLPKVSIQEEKVFSQKQRKQYVSDIIGMMQDWRSTPFEHEGSSIAGIRAGLCMAGHSWNASHNEAEILVGEAFKHMGASRPTYDEGQREYSIAPENCSWCGLAVPDELILSQRKTRFCSDVCARSAVRYRELKDAADTRTAYRAAYETISRTKQSVQACEQCGKGFRPMFAGGRFCSHECSSQYHRVLERKSCPTCCRSFRPRNATITFCSRACKDIAHPSSNSLIVKDAESHSGGGRLQWCFARAHALTPTKSSVRWNANAWLVARHSSPSIRGHPFAANDARAPCSG